MHLLNLPSIAELQPYIVAIAAVINIATLGFIIRVAIFAQKAQEERIKVLEEKNSFLETQVTQAKDDVSRTEKWSSRREEELTGEIDKYKNQLNASFANAGINLDTLILGQPTSLETKQIIEKTVQEMQETLAEINKKVYSEELKNPDWYLELGKGFMVARDWINAANHFDKYLQYYPLNWEAQFSKAVSYANSRSGKEGDLSALRGYNEAVALIPKDADTNLKARLFAYRGAMLKRLERLDEALADLEIAQLHATGEYEKKDIQYNLACVYALKGDREKLLNTVKSLSQKSNSAREFKGIHLHLNDYFAKFANDKEFLETIRII